MVKKIYTQTHTYTSKEPHTAVKSLTHTQVYVVANKVPNHEAYKMKIHPRKKLPRIFPLFFLTFLFEGEAKKKHAKSIVGLLVCVRVCVCARVCVGGGLAACFAFALFAKQSKANESPSPKPLATYHLPLASAASAAR